MASKQNIEDVENIVDVDEALDLNEVSISSGLEDDENKDQSSQRAASIEDEMELRWEDDDVDDISVTNEDALLEDVAMDNDDNLFPIEPTMVPDVANTSNIKEVSNNKFIEVSIDKALEPAKPHGLNKPDMMLEILTQDLSDLSDDEDFTNLKMSPDLEVEVSNIDKGNEVLILGKKLNRQTDVVEDEKSNDSLLCENIESDSDKVINNELCVEGNLAADLLRKELAMDVDDETMAVTLEDEDLLLRDDIENEQDTPIVEVDLNEDEINLDTSEAHEIQSKEERSMAVDKQNLSKSLPDSELNKDDITSIKEVKSLEMDIEKEALEMTEVVESEYIKIKKYTNVENNDSKKSSTSHIVEDINAPKEISNKADTETLKVQELTLTPIEKPKKKLSLKLAEASKVALKTLELDLELDEDSTEVQNPLTSEAKETKEIDNANMNPQPSTSGLKKNETISNTECLEIPKDKEPQPSTSNQNVSLFSSSIQDKEDVPESSDSLGLLSESFRIMGDEEVEDDDMEEEDGDDFEHFDESSNQMTAEHSEDSNHQHSDDVNETPNPTPTVEKDFNFTITGVITETTVVKMESDNNEDSNKSDIKSQSKESKIEEEEVKETNYKEDKEIETCDEAKDEKTISQPKEMSYVDLEESSSEEDAKESRKIDTETEIMETAEIIEKIQDENNLTKEDLLPEQSETTEVEPKTTEKTIENQIKTKSQGLEVFNLDSDDEESHEKPKNQPVPLENSIEQISTPVKCINKSCGRNSSDYYRADNTTVNFYDPERKKRGYVCQNCLDVVEKRNQLLISGIRELVPLLELNPGRPAEELVEISDSESEDEAEPGDPDQSTLGENGARFLEEKLCALMNATWQRFDLDGRLEHAQEELQGELEALQKESQEINQMLDDCQVTTDKLRTELYTTFECDIKELPAVVIYDVPNCSYTCVDPSAKGGRFLKRKKSASSEIPAKRSAIPLGYTPLADQNHKNMQFKNEKTEDENQDVSVVHLSVEAAPPDLPPAGELSHPPLRVGMTVYASKNVFGSWMKAKILEITPKTASMPFTVCRVKFEYKLSKPTKILPARCLAYSEPPDVRLTIGTRVIALFKDINMRDSFYSGIVAEIPNPVNNYRYLIFFDDGYAQYARHSSVRAVCERSALVWEEVQPKSRDFVRKYLLAYPERPMVRLHPGQSLKTEWRGNWWSSVVMSVDASLVEVQFTNRERREWIYRGSTRLAPLYLELQAAERHRPRALPRTQPHSRTNMPYVEYTRSDEQSSKQNESSQQQQQQTEELRRQRAVAKKSTTEVRVPPPTTGQNLDNVTSRVVYYTPKKQVKPLKMVPHTCSPRCRRSDVLALKDLRTYNPLAKPLLSGWERQIVRCKGTKLVSYVSPCGRRVRSAAELHRYLRLSRADLPVDLFDFSPSTHCLAEFVLNKCNVGKKDLSHGKENVPVPCVNYYDESLPEFCSYNTERTPTAGVPLNLDPEFLCGCDCEDDCEDKSKCACWKLTMEGARTIGLDGDVGYVYKRLPEPLPSGIYECNSRCKCKDTCLNRVAQHPLQLKLQVFKTLNRGWGIRALNDIPRGAFVCVYAGNLLTDATANLDGLNEGDEYLAELDYIEVVEQMKEGYEEDIPDSIKKLDQAELAKNQVTPEDEPESSSSEDDGSNNNGEEDDDFRPGYIGLGVTEFNKRLRRRDSKVDKENPVKKANDKDKLDMKKENDEECITISDDEEVREPSCFTAAAGMGANEFKSKYRSVRTLFGEDEACYIMDAKVQGNIGRYLNHSCVPNVFVQNVFVDTHDPRFPWVAFFALRAVRAGGELTWNYNYDVGSVPGKVLYCYCGAPTCRGRLL